MRRGETFGEALRRLRMARGLSLRKLQVLSSYDYTYLSQVERGKKPGSAELAGVCDQVLMAAGELLAVYEESDRLESRASSAPVTPTMGPLLSAAALALPVTERVDDDYLATIRSHIDHIVALDNRFGGAELARLTVRLFHSVHQQLGAGNYPKRLERDLQATAGELAEVAGWLYYDASQQDNVRRMNQESLYFSRLAGDRQMELLTLQNSSMHAGFLHRPREALQIVNSVLEGVERLSPRIRTLFLARKARALAQLGDESALRLFAAVRSLHQEGVGDPDPAWCWWVDERELAWHEAMANADLGNIGVALPLFEQAVAATQEDQRRSHYLHRGYLLGAQVAAASWSDAEKTMLELEGLVHEVASTRMVVLLRHVLDRIDVMQAPEAARERAQQLQRVLVAAA